MMIFLAGMAVGFIIGAVICVAAFFAALKDFMDSF